MARAGMTISDAAHEWVREMNAYPQEMIETLMRTKPDDWHEVTMPRVCDRVYVCNLPDGCEDYDPVTTQTSNFRFASHLPPERKMLLMQVMAMDNTHLKEALKYHALMCFMTHYREMVKIEDKGRRTKRQAKALRKDVTKPLPLIRKQYVIEEVDSKVLRLPDQKRTYTKPEHEVSVRGYMRHYKSGKSVWIEPFTKYRGKGKNRKDYEL